LKELAAGKGDGEILEWVQAHSKTPRAPWEIEAWSAFMEKRGPDSDAETLALFAEYLGQHSKTAKTSKPGSRPLNSTTMPALEEQRKSHIHKNYEEQKAEERKGQNI